MLRNCDVPFSKSAYDVFETITRYQHKTYFSECLYMRVSSVQVETSAGTYERSAVCLNSHVQVLVTLRLGQPYTGK